MSIEIQATAKDFPGAIPADDFNYLIAVLTGAQPLDRFKAIKTIYDVTGYLLGRFYGSATVASVAATKKASKKQVAAALQGLCDEASGKGKADVKAKAFPAWLIPILLELAGKLLANVKI